MFNESLQCDARYPGHPTNFSTSAHSQYYYLFAIAFAYELAAGNNPSDVSFEQGKMREHLVRCLERGHFEPFPRDKATPRFSKRQNCDIRLFCSCLRPECWDDMIQCELCDEWLHLACEGLETAPEGEWLCRVCRPPDNKRVKL